MVPTKKPKQTYSSYKAKYFGLYCDEQDKKTIMLCQLRKNLATKVDWDVGYLSKKDIQSIVQCYMLILNSFLHKRGRYNSSF